MSQTTTFQQRYASRELLGKVPSKILLIDADSRINLALMKLSRYHKLRGDKVFLMRGLNGNSIECPNPDKVYVSCIFTKNAQRILSIAKPNWVIGGYGINNNSLPDEIEHLIPDYDLYGIDYSMGFMTRGCIRQCPWCDVWRKEGKLKFNAPIKEFLSPRHNKLILLDNNLLAYSGWDDQLRDVILDHVKVNFNQGLDIRLVDSWTAETLSVIKYYDWRFKNRRLHFAFDLPNIEGEVLDGIMKLERAEIPRHHLMFYVLIGFNTSYEDDLHRIDLLIREKVKPYVMVHNDRKDSYYNHLERWVNGRYYEVVDWESYRKRKGVAIY